jgi:endonuclease YncB( thermonuclease family)
LLAVAACAPLPQEPHRNLLPAPIPQAKPAPAEQALPDQRLEDNSVLVGTVTRVVDGDTIHVQLASGPIEVRFSSSDAPEKDQTWGREAKLALEGRISTRRVTLVPVEQDRYDRLIAFVYLDDEDLNGWMVQQGHAWAYRDDLEDDRYCALEAAARSAERGLWAPSQSPAYAPWEWRKEKRGSPDGFRDYRHDTAEDCLAASGKRSRTPERLDASGGCLIKGNMSKNGDRIYHVPGSPSYDSTIIDESKGEGWFCTEEEARAARWRPPR